MDSFAKPELHVSPFSNFPMHPSYTMLKPTSPHSSSVLSAPAWFPGYSPAVKSSPLTSTLGSDASSYFPRYPDIPPCVQASESERGEPTPTTKHIPRPANAFMLFRSDFLKKGIIPSNVERRQQNLSRVAGECWNLMPAEEKKRWKDLAEQELVKHRTLYPNYKFSPAPRGSGKARGGKCRRGIEETEMDDKRRIRELRETYAHVAGPAAMPTRRRRPKEPKLKVEAICDTAFEDALSSPLPASKVPSPAQSPALASTDTPFTAPSLPRFFPANEPHYAPPRRPSTSLGFASRHDFGESHSPFLRPSSAASSETGISQLVRDLHITPTTVDFLHFPLPQPSTNVSPTNSFSNLDATLGLSDLRLPYHSLSHAYPDSATPSPTSSVNAAYQQQSLTNTFYFQNGEPYTFGDDSGLDQDESRVMAAWSFGFQATATWD